MVNAQRILTYGALVVAGVVTSFGLYLAGVASSLLLTTTFDHPLIRSVAGLYARPPLVWVFAHQLLIMLVLHFAVQNLLPVLLFSGTKSRIFAGLAIITMEEPPVTIIAARIIPECSLVMLAGDQKTGRK